MLVDVEYDSRKSNRLKKLIRGAGFEQGDASVADIDYGHGRKLNKELIQRLATCEYISGFFVALYLLCRSALLVVSGKL